MQNRKINEEYWGEILQGGGVHANDGLVAFEMNTFLEIDMDKLYEEKPGAT